MWIWGTARRQGIQRQGCFSKWSQCPRQDCSSGTVDYHILKLTIAHPVTNWTTADLSGGGRNWTNCCFQIGTCSKPVLTFIQENQVFVVLFQKCDATVRHAILVWLRSKGFPGKKTVISTTVSTTVHISMMPDIVIALVINLKIDILEKKTSLLTGL